MEEKEEQLIWKSEPAPPESMVSVTLGRAMTTLLTARPTKLHDAVSRLFSDPKTITKRVSSSLGSLEDSLWFLHKYVNDAVENKEALDQILVPMIEHSLRWKESKKHGSQAMILLNWLFQDELLFQAVATNLANIFVTKDDRYIAFGWCTLLRSLLEYESSMNPQYPMNGIRERYNDLLKIVCSCMPHLLRIVCKGSVLQDGFELPFRLSVAAADCFLALTEALIKKVSNNRPMSKSNGSNRPIALVPASTGDKKAKQPASKSSEVSNMEMGFLFWDHLEELISLAQRLLAWSRKSRPLHVKGLEKVLKWLQEIKGHYGCFQDEAQRVSRLEYCYSLPVGSIMACYCTWKITIFLSITKNCWTSTYLESSIILTTILESMLRLKMVV